MGNLTRQNVKRFVDCYKVPEINNTYETRRIYPRFPFAEQVDVMIDEFGYPAEVIQATGRDVSLGGIGFYSPVPIPSGTEIIVDVDNGRERLLARAVTVHSTLSLGLFKVGAKFVV